MKEIKTNLRWAGGKSKMMKILDKYIPKKINKYLETFTGGGSVLLHVLQRHKLSSIYANDIDPNLINYYKSIQEDHQKVIEECLKYKELYNAEDFRNVFNGIDTTTAAGFFTANKTSFSGLNSNYSIQTYDTNFSVNSINKIADVSNVIKDVKFKNSDFKLLDDSIDEPIEDFFIYMDPPYFGNKDKGLYGKKGELHKDFDHESMLEWVNAHSDNNQIMLSYDDSPYIRELYKGYNIYNFDFTYCMTNTGGNKCKVGKEIVITNYKVDCEDEDIDRLR